MNYDGEVFTLKKKWDRRVDFSKVKSFWVRVSVLVILLLIMGGVFPSTRSVSAFEPNLDYCYTETLTVADVALPEGVVISTSDPGNSPRGYLSLQNKTNTLLLVISLNYKDVLVMATLDANWESRVNGAHEVASYLVTPERPVVLDMEALADLDHALKDQNVLDYELPEEDVPTPATQSSELLLVYDGKVIEVPFTVAYTSNAQCDNGIEANQAWMASVEATIGATLKATQQAEASAERAEEIKLLGMGLTLVAGVAILGWMLWRRAARSKK